MGPYAAAQVDEHLRKRRLFWKTAVQFRFHQARHNAEHIFDGGAQAHHTVRFQLADVDNQVRIQNRRNHLKGFRDRTTGGFQLPAGAILIQGKAIALRRIGVPARVVTGP